MSNKTRLDVLLTEQGLAGKPPEGTGHHYERVWCSSTASGWTSPARRCPNDAKIEIRGNTLKYVSRGGLKLEKAMADISH